MERGDVFAYIKEEYQTEPDYPFSGDYAQTPVFRHRDTGKWFALCMRIRAQKLGVVSDSGWVEALTLKSDPLLIDGLVGRPGFHRAYHMNKTRWLTIELGKDVPDQEIRDLIDLSFELTDKKRKIHAHKKEPANP